MGENIQVRRLVRIATPHTVAAYVHGNRIGVLVEIRGSAELAHGVAMHIAAMNPPYINASAVPADYIAKEKEIEVAKMTDAEKSKPAQIVEKIIHNKVAKIIDGVTLYGQPYVLNTKQTVGQVMTAEGAEVLRFHRLVVGEGIEKVVEDYAAEVMKQAGLT